MRNLLSNFSRLLALAALLLLSACASMDGGGDSDIPWNAPQSWEGTPGIPGLSR